MTAAAALLARLRAAGLTLWVEETPEGLTPKLLGKPTSEDRVALAGQRSEIVALLLEEARAESEARSRVDPPSPWRK